MVKVVSHVFVINSRNKGTTTVAYNKALRALL